MDFRPIERAPEAFQRSVTGEQALAMCRRAFGAQVQPVSVVELGYGAALMPITRAISASGSCR